jgi:hypothetical protein
MRSLRLAGDDQQLAAQVFHTAEPRHVLLSSGVTRQALQLSMHLVHGPYAQQA